MKKRLPVLLATGMIAFTMFTANAVTVSANSLDDVIGGNSSTVQQDNSYSGQLPNVIGADIGTSGNQSMVNDMKDATNLSDPAPQANAVNAAIKKLASIIVQVLSYFTTAFLVVRVLLDILYISIPFSRNLLANGHQGQAQGGQQGAGGMSGGFGGGMGGFGGGMGGMSGGMGGMGGQQQGQQGQGTQWVSNAALNAVATEQSGAKNALKLYAKDMTIVLILTPVFLVLAVTGTLTNLGFMIGDALVSIISGLGNMI